jgi:hypothetical protein
MIALRAVSLALGISLLLASETQGRVIRVPEDLPSILVAVDSSAVGDSILVGPGHWTQRATRLVNVAGNLLNITSSGFLKPGITIIGLHGPEATIVDAGPADVSGVITFLHVLPGDDVTRIEGLTITGGGDGIVAALSSRLELESCWIIDNPRNALLLSSAEGALTDCLVRSNAFDFAGIGALHAHSSSIELVGCCVEDNANGGLLVEYWPSHVLIDGCEFLNHSSWRGADLYLVDDLIVRNTLFSGNAIGGLGWGGGLQVADCTGVIEFCTFENDTCRSLGLGGGLGVIISQVRVENNTFYGCHAFLGSAVGIDGPDAGFARNVVANSTGGPALWKSGGPLNAQSGCSVIWANASGDFGGDWSPAVSDIFADPQFCDAEAGDYTVHNSSPCTEKNSGGCGAIGAFGVGCGIVSVEPRSWGRIKDSYRSGVER